MAAEQCASSYLQQAFRHWLLNETDACINDLRVSLRLKASGLALLFQDFLIQQQAQLIVDLLAQKQVLAAKKQLFIIRLLLPQSSLLRQLQAFADYLLAQNSNALPLDSQH
jgi:hypothetical protein